MKPLFSSTKFFMLIVLLVNFSSTWAQMDYTIGNGTATNGTTGYPSPMCDWHEGDRHQYLFLASELTAAGMSAGVITAIKWNVTGIGTGTPLSPGYKITIGTTTASTMTAWQPNITHLVFGPTNYNHFIGINSFTLPTPFVWNGVDNIVIETCHGKNGTGFTYNAQVPYTTTGFQSVAYYFQDCGCSLCGTSSAPSTSTSRANTTFTFGLPCTGVPVNEVAGPTEICPNIGFNLGFATFFSGITVNWEKSTDGINWTPFTGSVNLVGILRDSITVNTYYRATIKCNSSNLTYTTAPFLVKISEFYYCYCDNGATPSTSENRVNIGKVKLTAIPGNNVRLNNVTITGSQVSNANANRNYTDFRRTLPPVKMYRDSSFVFELSQFNRGGTLTASTVLAFLDYDRNGVFDDYERVHFSNSFNYGVPGEILDTFKVSDTAHIGLTGMRIIIKNGNDVPDSCGNYTNGETEDYLVDIRYQPCTGPVNAGIIEASDTTMCIDYMYIVTDTTYERRLSETSRTWQMSADNVVWNTVTNSSSKDSLMRIFNRNQPFYYRMQMTCDPTRDTTYSNTMLINQKPSYKCYCYSQSEGVFGTDTSDLGGFKIVGFDLNQGGAHLGNPKAFYTRKDFTDMAPVELTVDSSYVINIYHTMPTNHHGDAKVTLFMDFNNNHIYDIPEDRVYTGFTSTSSFVLTPTIRIPNNAIVGRETGMRLIVNNDISPNAASDSACGTYASGETEDYMVYFRREFPVNINTVEGIRNLQVFPNPTTGKFHIEFQHGSTVKEIHINVSNVTGQKVMSRTYTGSGSSFSQDLSLEGATPGIYFIELNADGNKQVQRLTVR